MGTSSNFGNMFCAAGASLFLSFLPMLPTQILLNNLLYDVSEMTIPTDTVDEELLARPSHWDIGLIRRFMVFFGPISSRLRLPHLRRHAPGLRRRPDPVPLRLVRRVAGHADARDLRHPHPPRPVLQEPAQQPLLAATLGCAAIGVAAALHRPLAACSASLSRPRSSPSSPCMIITYLALAQLGVALFFQPAGGRPLARTISHRTAPHTHRITLEHLEAPHRHSDTRPHKLSGLPGRPVWAFGGGTTVIGQGAVLDARTPRPS